MNIIVVRGDGSYYTRPDTSVKREAVDYFIPDGISSILAFRAVYIKIIKSGKSISSAFAHRYFNSFGYGALLYGISQQASEPLIYMDYTTILLKEMHPYYEMDSQLVRRVIAGIEETSRLMTLRIGDVIVFETDNGVSLNQGDTFEVSSAEGGISIC